LGGIGGGLLVFLWAQQFLHCGEKKNPPNCTKACFGGQKKKNCKTPYFEEKP
jgi:hypothetical protein